MSKPVKGVSPARASPEKLVELLNEHAIRSLRLALACFKRWEELEEKGTAAGVENINKLREIGGPQAIVAAMGAHASKDAALAERGMPPSGSNTGLPGS